MIKYFFLSLTFLAIGVVKTTNGQSLDPGDGIRITLFNVSEEISGDYYIQQNGILQLPYLGLMRTFGIEYNTIKSDIEAKYDSLYRGVELIVSPLHRINVLGEVQNPGVYYVTGVEKLLDVVAMAGGETEDSDMSEILVQRKTETLDFDAEELITGEGDAKDFYLKSGDRIFVTRKWWVTAQNMSFLFTAANLIVTIFAVATR